jgi:hypothetical protein
MRLIQLTDNNTCESIGLYTCSNSELSEEQIDEMLKTFHNLNEEGKYDEADMLIQSNGIERIYIEQEVLINE